MNHSITLNCDHLFISSPKPLYLLYLILMCCKVSIWHHHTPWNLFFPFLIAHELMMRSWTCESICSPSSAFYSTFRTQPLKQDDDLKQMLFKTIFCSNPEIWQKKNTGKPWGSFRAKGVIYFRMIWLFCYYRSMYTYTTMPVIVFP